MTEASFDMAAAHRWFAGDCFNRTWDLMEKKERSAAEDEEMIELALASAWHWSQRPERTDENISAGYWQIARVYTLLGQIENARRYGQMCLDAGKKEGVGPFYLGYGYEALARAEAAAGNLAEAAKWLAAARETSELITDAEEKQLLENDLETI